MLTQIKGLHHVTSMAADAQENNSFFTKTLGLRRVKKTVNFDAPDVYHLYYGDEVGNAGSVMTYFPFANMGKGGRGAGEVSETVFSVPKGTLGFWQERLSKEGVKELGSYSLFGEDRLRFAGGPVGVSEGIHGFRGVTMRLRDEGATGELLKFMGYQPVDKQGDFVRYAVPGGNGADYIDLEVLPGASRANQGAGSVHHVAFAVEDRAAQLEVRKALLDTGYQVTPVIDRDYFWAIYFRTPGGVLFEIATNEPGFNRDEDTAHLGEALKLPTRYQQYRAQIEAQLPPIQD